MLPTPAYPSAKKAGATPSGAGYRKGDLAQAVIALAVPGKPMPAAGAQRSVLGGKIADTRRPGPPVGGGTRLWYSCYDIFLREGQPMTHETPPFSADAALRHFRSYFTEPKDVVAHPQLSRDEKLAILREWEQDALRLSTSESEGMGGGEESMLGRVEESIGILERSPR